MTTRLALGLFLVGLGLVLLAALLKIMHWPGADIIIILGMSLQVAGGLVFLYKLFAKPGNKKV
ncbi:MAG: hypothetical protein EOO56_11630 [Hymenobacter sp.]|nr:MAG: hypothetical protein EOO56_11630 [Hymenobacter sp.]